MILFGLKKNVRDAEKITIDIVFKEDSIQKNSVKNIRLFGMKENVKKQKFTD